MKFFYCAFLMLISINLFAQIHTKEEIETFKKNRIAEIHHYGYNLTTGDSVLFDKEYFDEEGNKIMHESINNEREVDFRSEWIYNKSGHHERSISTNFEKNTKDTVHWKWEGDSVRYSLYMNAERDTIYTYKIRYAYDGMDSLKWHAENGKFILDDAYFYDKNRIEVRQVRYQPNGSIFEETIPEFDSNGWIVGRFSQNGDTLIRKYKYKRDSKGRRTAIIFSSSGLFYTSGGYNTAQEMQGGNGYIITYERRFKYDSEGNKIQEERYENGKLMDRLRYYFVKRDEVDLPNNKEPEGKTSYLWYVLLGLVALVFIALYATRKTT